MKRVLACILVCVMAGGASATPPQRDALRQSFEQSAKRNGIVPDNAAPAQPDDIDDDAPTGDLWVLPEAANDRFWESKKDGWFWYHDPRLEQRKKRAQARKPGDGEVQRKYAKELARFETMQRSLEDLRKVMIMEPSDENIRNYVRYQSAVIQRSIYVADKWQRLTWTEQEFQLGIRPVNNLGIQVFDEQKRIAKEQHVGNLAKSHGLFFYFRNNCPYCHALAPIVKRFSQQTGIKVYPITMDGQGIPDYPDAVPDRGTAAKIIPGGITMVPALVLAVPSTGERQVVGFGVLSDMELYERIYMLTAVQPGTGY
jgi:conjugal transfer pilus assembly protein TraF